MATRFLTDKDQEQLVQVTPQALTEPEQRQARANIGAAAPEDIPADALLYGVQALTEEQKAQARANVGAAAAEDIPADTLLYGAQALTEEQKAQARANVGAAAAEDIPADALLYGAQALTEEQKAQARTNIGAVASPAAAAVGQTIVVLEVDQNGFPTCWEAAAYPAVEDWVFTLEDDSTVTKKVAVFL